jgi:hypothetical protein
MSVLACHRNGCDNIMCDRLSQTYGYICNECFDELVGLGPETNINSFMDSEKKGSTKDEAYARFDAAFPFTY